MFPGILLYLIPLLWIYLLIAAFVFIPKFADFMELRNYFILVVLGVVALIPGLNIPVAIASTVIIIMETVFHPPEWLDIKRKYHVPHKW